MGALSTFTESVKTELATHNQKSAYHTVTLTWAVTTADPPDTANWIPEVGGFALWIMTTPTGTPTDNYDISAVEPEGTIDVFDSLLADRDTSNTEKVYLKPTDAVWPVFIRKNQTYVFTISNNSQNSSGGTVVLLLLES